MVGRNQNGYITGAFSGSPWRGKSKWLHHPCLLGVPMVGKDQNGYITPTFLGSPWWEWLNLEKSGCGGDEHKIEKKGGNG